MSCAGPQPERGQAITAPDRERPAAPGFAAKEELHLHRAADGRLFEVDRDGYITGPIPPPQHDQPQPDAPELEAEAG
jgi:hypothetical protein